MKPNRDLTRLLSPALHLTLAFGGFLTSALLAFLAVTNARVAAATQMPGESFWLGVAVVAGLTTVGFGIYFYLLLAEDRSPLDGTPAHLYPHSMRNRRFEPGWQATFAEPEYVLESRDAEGLVNLPIELVFDDTDTFCRQDHLDTQVEAACEWLDTHKRSVDNRPLASLLERYRRWHAWRLYRDTRKLERGGRFDPPTGW